MSLRFSFRRSAVSLVAASSILVTSVGILRAQVGGPDIDPFSGSDLETPAGPATDGTGPAGEPVQQTAEEVLAEAQTMFENGNYAGALQVYNTILRYNPNFGLAHLMRGKCYAAIGEKELALSAFASAANYSPQAAEPAIEKGKIYMELRDYKNAVEDFTRGVQADPFRVEVLVLRAKATLKLAQITQQSPSLLGGDNTGALVESAVSSLERAIQIEPNNAEAYAQLALAKSFRGDTDESIADALKAISLDKDAVQYSARLAFAYKGRADNENSQRYDKDLTKAAADYTQAISAFEDYIKVKGDPGMDQSEFEEDPELIKPQDVYLARALTYIALADITSGASRNTNYQNAIDDCNKALEFEIAFENKATALTERGIAQRSMGNSAAAIQSYNDAIDVAGRFPEALIRRGIAYYHQDDLESALTDFEEFMQQPRQRFDARAKFWIGVIHARRGEFREAILSYSAALRQNPGYRPAYNNRGLAYMRVGRYDQAAEDFAYLLHADPDDPVSRSRRDQALQMMRNEMASN